MNFNMKDKNMSNRIIEEYIKIKDKNIGDKYQYLAKKFNVQRKSIKWLVFSFSFGVNADARREESNSV